ncbi:hypothetical protein PGQ11_007972 [Apiospora arundinis]|uniref:Uncharacterized protein n=1 Tax=Apiospora arundinis TaxID=335852 RepID=A0ABR2IXW8_9PEZI
MGPRYQQRITGRCRNNGPRGHSRPGDTGDSSHGGLSKGSVISLDVALPFASLTLWILAHFLWRQGRHQTQESGKPTAEDEDDSESGLLGDGGVLNAASVLLVMLDTTTGFWGSSSTTELNSEVVNELSVEQPSYEANPDAHPSSLPRSQGGCSVSALP